MEKIKQRSLGFFKTCFLSCFLFISSVAFADQCDTVKVTASTEIVCVGDTVTVYISAENIPEVCGLDKYQFALLFDSTVLDYIGYNTAGTLMEDAQISDADADTVMEIVSLPGPSNSLFIGSGNLIQLKFIAKNAGTSYLNFKPNSFHFNGILDTNLVNGSVTVHPLPDVTLNDFDTLPLSGGMVKLTGGTPLGGIYSGHGIINSPYFDPILAGPGTHEIVYTYTNGNGCSSSDTSEITVNCDPTVTANGGEVCQGDTITVSISTSEILESCGLRSYMFALKFNGDLLDYVGYDQNGTLNETADVKNYDLDTVVVITSADEDGTFLTGAGDLIKLLFVAKQAGTSYLNFKPNTVAFEHELDTNLVNGSVTVHPLPDVTLNDFDTLSLNGGTVELTGGTPAGGVYSGPGITASPTFDPQAAGPGTHKIVYTYTNGNGCSSSDSSEITVVNFDPALTVANVEGCVGDTIAVDISTSQLLEIHQILNYHGKLLFDHTMLEFVDHEITGTISENSLTASRLDGIDSVKFQSVFISSKRYVGVGSLIKIKFIVLAEGTSPLELIHFHYNNIDQENLIDGSATTHPLPDVALNDFDTLPLNGGTVELTGGTPAGGVYSGPGITASPTFDPQAAGPGTHKIVYTYTNGNGCSSSDTSEITVNCDPTVTANGGEVCEGDTITVSISTSVILESCGLDNYQFSLQFNSEILDYIGYDRTGTLNETARIYDFDMDTMVGIVALPGLDDTQLIGAGDLIKLNFVAVNSGNSYLDFIPDFFRFNGILDTNLVNGSVTVNSIPAANPTYSMSESDPVYYTFEANGSPEVSSVHWDFGDGTSSSKENPVHMFAPGGSDGVNLIVTSDKGCATNDTITNHFTAPDYFYIKGNVDAGGVDVDRGKAIAYTIIEGNYYIVDTTDIINGQYEFYPVPGGQYIVYAIPETTEEGYVPTYYGNKTVWEDAHELSLISGEGVVSVNISLIMASESAGTSIISGAFLWNHFKSGFANGLFDGSINKNETDYSVPGLVVVLYNKDYVPVMWTITNDRGEYGFDELKDGTYYLRAEAPGYSMDFIELTVNQNLIFNMVIQGDEIIAGTETIAAQQQAGTMVYPNPVYANSLLTVFGIPTQHLHVKIYNSMGILQIQKAFRGKADIELNHSDFSSGFYIYKLYQNNRYVDKGSFIVK